MQKENALLTLLPVVIWMFLQSTLRTPVVSSSSAECPEMIPEEYVLSFPIIVPSTKVNGIVQFIKLMIFTAEANRTVQLTVVHSRHKDLNDIVIFSNTSHTIHPASTTLVLFLSDPENSPVSPESPDVVTVTSDDRIVVYSFYNLSTEKGLNESFSYGSRAKPVSQLGYHHVLPLQLAPLPSLAAVGTFSMITAAVDSTRVYLRLPTTLTYTVATQALYEAVDYRQKTWLQTILQAGETITVHSRSSMKGVYVHSDRPVLVHNGLLTKYTEGAADCCWGNPWVELPPIESWGTDFITPSQTGYHILMPSQAGTVITLNGGTTFTLPSAHKATTVRFTNPSHTPRRFLSSSSVLIVRATSITDTGRLSLAVLTNLSSLPTSLTFPRPEFRTGGVSNNFTVSLTIVTQQQPDNDHIILDDQPINITWRNDSMSGATESYVVGELVLLEVNNTDTLHRLTSTDGQAKLSVQMIIIADSYNSSMAIYSNILQTGCNGLAVHVSHPSHFPTTTGRTVTCPEYFFTFPHHMPQTTALLSFLTEWKQVVLASPNPNTTVNVHILYGGFSGSASSITHTLLLNTSFAFSSRTTRNLSFNTHLVWQLATNRFPHYLSITADSDITVHVYSAEKVRRRQNELYSHGVGAALNPVEELGQKYVVNLLASALPDGAPRGSFFLVTAVHNETFVEISMPVEVSLSIVCHVAYQTSEVGSRRLVNVTLPEKMSLTGSLSVGDITGVVINSDKRVAVTNGFRDVSSSDPSKFWSYPWAPLRPVKDWGDNFVALPTEMMPSIVKSGVYQFSSNTSNTQIRLNSSTLLRLHEAAPATSVPTTAADLQQLVGNAQFQPQAVLSGALDRGGKLDHCILGLTSSDRWATTLVFPMPDVSLVFGGYLTVWLRIVTEHAKTKFITLNGQAIPNVSWTKVDRFPWLKPVAISNPQLLDINSSMHVLSSVSGTSRMAAYVMIGEGRLLTCFPLTSTRNSSGITNCSETMITEPNTTTTIISTTATTLPTSTSVVTTTTESTAITTASSSGINGVTVESETQTPNSRPDTATSARPKPAIRIQPCFCVRRQWKQHGQEAANSSLERQAEQEEAIAAVTKHIKVNLTMSTRNISATIRTTTSAHDQRPSSAGMGYVAIGILTFLFLLPLSFDCISIVFWLRERCGYASAFETSESHGGDRGTSTDSGDICQEEARPQTENNSQNQNEIKKLN